MRVGNQALVSKGVQATGIVPAADLFASTGVRASTGLHALAGLDTSTGLAAPATGLHVSTAVDTVAGRATATSPAPAPVTDLQRAPEFHDAAAALRLLGTGAIEPVGAVRQALDANRLLRTGAPAVLDHLELTLRTGEIDSVSRIRVGSGTHGERTRQRIADPTSPGAAKIWAVSKPAAADAAQEEFAWRIARELGIDHLIAAVGRREDGTAWIQYHHGATVGAEGITDAADLERALAASYLADDALRLTPLEAAQAARIDRQLLQLFDYILANVDRKGDNALIDVRHALRFTGIDQGRIGLGEAVSGATQLRPGLRGFQAGPSGGRVSLDPAVVDYARRRLAPERVHRIHTEVFHESDAAVPAPDTLSGLIQEVVRRDSYADAIVNRLEHALEHGGYSHVGYETPVLDRLVDTSPLLRQAPPPG